MAHQNAARVILREIPVGSVRHFLDVFGRGNPVANGDACGNGCGNNCIDGTGFVLDRFGQSEVQIKEMQAAQKDIQGLKKALLVEVQRLLK